MLKTVLAGVTMLALAGGSFVYAQQRGDGGPRSHRWQMSDQDRGAMTDARIAALKAGLKLTAEQEKNWPALEKALRDQSKSRGELFAARRADKPSDPVERLQRRAEAMTQQGAALKGVADAAKPLYQSLDDAQKHRFKVLAQLDRQRFGRGHHWRRHGHEGHHMMHHADRTPEGTGDGQQKPQ
jgi:hypothetical protein